MYNVLLADDESVIIDGLKRLIPWEEYGLAIKDIAKDGETALNLIKNNGFDILLTDVKMPKMNGLDLLRNINDCNINIKSVIISGYDEFEYIKQAMQFGIQNYLLKPINDTELSSTLLNIINKLNDEKKNRLMHEINANTIFDNILLRMMSGSIENDELVNRAKILDIDICKTNYLTAVAKLYQDEKRGVDSSHVIQSLQQKTDEICLALKGSQPEKDKTGSCYISILPSNELILLFGSNETIDMAAMHKALQDQLNVICKKAGCYYFAALGSLCQGIELVADSFANARKMLAYSFIMDHNMVVSYENMVNRASDLNIKLNISLKDLDNLLLKDSVGNCETKINNVFSEIKKQPAFSPSEFKSLVVNLFFHVFGICESSKDVSFGVDFGHALYNILNMENIEEIRNWFLHTATEIIERRNNQKENMNPIAKNILSYVESHYKDDLCLKTIADKLNLSPTYCGQIFKQETGVLFTEYLCNYRIEKAKHMLLNTNMKSCDIAEHIGFFNSNYFANVFNKKVGMYPSKFRRMTARQ